jgi:hypothetical protein
MCLFICNAEKKKKGVYSCPKPLLPKLACNCNATLLQSNADITTAPAFTHCESCLLTCACSISCSASLSPPLSFDANAESMPDTEIVPNINADAMKIANMPTLWFFVIFENFFNNYLLLDCNFFYFFNELLIF